MKRSASIRRGFTIIEVMLFLGITGAMIAGMLIGVGSSIGAQRYRDAVESLKSEIQQQYSDVVNVMNTRTNTEQQQCSVSDGKLAVTPVDAGGATRGQSSRCMIVGTYLAVRGSEVKRYTILGYAPRESIIASSDDISILKSGVYTFGIDPESTESKSLEWGTQMKWAGDTNTGDPLGILVLRSPNSGNIYTFTSRKISAADPDNASLTAMITPSLTADESGRGRRLICVDPQGLVMTPTRGIILDAYAADSNAVHVALPDDFKEGESC